MSPRTRSKKVAKKAVRRILIVENSYRPGIGLFIETLFKSENDPMLEASVVDTDEALIF